MHLNRARISALDLYSVQSLHRVQIQHILVQKSVTANLSAECPQINTKIEVKTKVAGKSVIEHSLKKTKARLNAAYAILSKKEIQ